MESQRKRDDLIVEKFDPYTNAAAMVVEEIERRLAPEDRRFTGAELREVLARNRNLANYEIYVAGIERKRGEVRSLTGKIKAVVDAASSPRPLVQPVGYLLAERYKASALIHRVAVQLESRRTGVADFLLDQLISNDAALPLSRVEVCVDEYNDAGIGLFKRRGQGRLFAGEDGETDEIIFTINPREVAVDRHFRNQNQGQPWTRAQETTRGAK